MNIIDESTPETSNLYRAEIVKPPNSVSYQSYFNAFPASYWQNHTELKSLNLAFTIEGHGRISVYRSNEFGRQIRVSVLEADQTGTYTIPLALDGFHDGGFYWFDTQALSDDFALIEASWRTNDAPLRQEPITIAITTFNKPDYCVRTIRNIAADSTLLEVLDQIVLVDQGNKLVQDEPGFLELSQQLGNQLKVIRQDNLGGSGGFSRGMYEALKSNPNGQVLLLDDDVSIETESIKRALIFSRYTTKTTIVGGHMFDLNFPNVLHAFAEVVEQKSFYWTQKSQDHYRHNFAKKPLSKSSWMHRYRPADFNGWWMCLIPVEVIRTIGLGLPFFIKWDDAEYGLRAKKAGYATVSLPGVVLWHISWLDKDDAQDWQAYFHARNRFITALLHQEEPGGGVLIAEHEKHNFKRLLALQYYSARLTNNALRDVLDTSIDLHDILRLAMPEAREIALQYQETIKLSEQQKPQTISGRQDYTDFNQGRPTGIRLLLWLAQTAPRHFYRKSRKYDRPVVEFPKLQGTWWRVAKYDSYLVEASAQDGYFWFNRDRRKFAELLKESRSLHSQLKAEWSSLQQHYQSQLESLSSPDRWAKTFGIDTGEHVGQIGLSHQDHSELPNPSLQSPAVHQP